MTLAPSRVELPATIDELQKFILVGQAKLEAVRALIRGIDKIPIANEVREQKNAEAHLLAGALLDAEGKLGELIKAIPDLKGRDLPGKASSGRSLKDYGLSQKQSHYFQILADHPDVVEQVKADATGSDKLPTRTEVLKRVKKQKRDEARAKLVARGKTASQSNLLLGLYVGDITTVSAKLSPGSVDVIITDPPYSKEYLNLYTALSQSAATILKPGGSCFVMTGQSYLPDVIAALSKSLRYNWTIAYLTPGGMSAQLWDRKVNTFWKPVLWFVNGKYSGDWKGDVVSSKVNDDDKRFHEWGQSESGMLRLVESFTHPGDLIFDPFLGAGTTGVACLLSQRRFIGSDINQHSIDLAKGRLSEASGLA